jgi:PAS domain S-box-containing protein
VSGLRTRVAARDDSQQPPELHLRALLERLPVPLLRVDARGTLLAVNEAGLALLGANTLDEVLGQSLFTFLPDASQTACKTFLEGVIRGQDGSLDVDLRAQTGASYAVELHAIAHPGTGDAAPSAMISVHDVTSWRHLAQSLEDMVARKGVLDAAHAAERSRRTEEPDLRRQAEVSHQVTVKERASLPQRLDTANQALDDLRARCEALESERQQLNEAGRDDLDRHRHTIEQLNERLATLASERQQALDAADALRADAVTRTLEFQRALDDQRLSHESRLLEASGALAAAQQSHAARLEEVQAAHRATIAALEAAHESRLADAETAHHAGIAELDAAYASRQAGAETAAAQALAREQELRAAMKRAVAKFASERQRLESANGAAREAEQSALAAWSAEQAERVRAEDSRQQLVDAIARLARDAALLASTGDADAASTRSHGGAEHDADMSNGIDSTKKSAW